MQDTKGRRRRRKERTASTDNNQNKQGTKGDRKNKEDEEKRMKEADVKHRSIWSIGQAKTWPSQRNKRGGAQVSD